jgi:hypothetical protein
MTPFPCPICVFHDDCIQIALKHFLIAKSCVLYDSASVGLSLLSQFHKVLNHTNSHFSQNLEKVEVKYNQKKKYNTTVPMGHSYHFCFKYCYLFLVFHAGLCSPGLAQELKQYSQ